MGTMGFFTASMANNPLLGDEPAFLSTKPTAGHQPLRMLLQRTVDFQQLHAAAGLPTCPKFGRATNVRTGQGEIFTAQRISTDAIMAWLACRSCTKRWRWRASTTGMAAFPVTLCLPQPLFYAKTRQRNYQ